MQIEVKNLTKTFPGSTAPAVENVSFVIQEGHLAALLGPSGSGKTTILRMIAGLEKEDSGDILIGGNSVAGVSADKRGIGFVFQNYALFRYMTVFENVAFGLRVQKKTKKEIDERVNEMLKLIGLADLGNRYPDELSGGQRQRVAFARAIAPNPKVLLLDEPFAAIDAKVRSELRSWLSQMIKEVGITSIFVTHDQEEAVEVADEIILLSEGKLEQQGNPVDIYKHPQTPFVAQFIGTGVVTGGFTGFKGYPDDLKDKKVVIRPEFVEAFKSDNKKFSKVMPASEEGTITHIAFRGNILELTLSVNGMEMKCHRSLERRPVAIGEKMRVLLYRVYVLDQNETMILKNELLRGVDVEAL